MEDKRFSIENVSVELAYPLYDLEAITKAASDLVHLDYVQSLYGTDDQEYQRQLAATLKEVRDLLDEWREVISDAVEEAQA